MRAERSGLEFAFRVRCAAILVVAVSVVVLVPPHRTFLYLGFAAAFFLLGYVPFATRDRRWAERMKLACVVLDVGLITAAVLNLPPGSSWIDWPMQTRLRGSNFLLLLLLLGEASLTYSPRRVLWTGGWILAIWSAAFAFLYGRLDSLGFDDMGAQTSDEALLALFLSPTYVSLPQWLTQLVVTAVKTVMLAVAAYRSRVHLEAQVRAEVTRADLARYVSPDVATALASPSGPRFGEPASRHVAVLFADIVGFTGISERLTPKRTFALLRSFQDRSTQVVFRHQGTLDKFLGDGLMATFGALRDEQDAAARAVACAFDLRREVERWSAKRVRRGSSPVELSVGVHYGPVVAGNIGSGRRIEFTAVGDVVNVASRLEQATREFRCAVVVSDACLAAAKPPVPSDVFERAEHASLRGRSDTLLVHLAGCR